jgi:arginine/lysine/ornithine decarboxylase
MGELHEWVRYWRKNFSKCSRMHKHSSPLRHAYAELSDYLDRIEDSADRQELDGTVLWAVKFMQRMHELEQEVGLLVPDKKVPLAKYSVDSDRH